MNNKGNKVAQKENEDSRNQTQRHERQKQETETIIQNKVLNIKF